jgi:SAM-dependent methyltransferase
MGGAHILGRESRMGATQICTNRFFPKLLPKTALIKTCDVDQAALNFHPLLGLIARLRFWIILSLLPHRRFSRLLEIGYGSGIFLPELARHCDYLYGVDIHRYATDVLCHLRHHQVDAQLVCGSATGLPFADKSFDCIVAMSCLEYMDPFDTAAREVKRVLRSDGCFVFVSPGNSPLIDFGHDLLFPGRCVRNGYGDRRDFLVPTLMKYFAVQRELEMPQVGGRLFTLYRGLRVGIS